MIRNAEEKEVPAIAELVGKTWYKHKFFELGIKYEKPIVKKKLIEYIESPTHHVFVGIIDNCIRGYLILATCESVFSRQKIIIQTALQSDPSLGKYKESIMIKKFMKFTDDFLKEKDFNLQCMSLSHTHDFSKHLEKKGYKLSDKIFIRKVI